MNIQGNKGRKVTEGLPDFASMTRRELNAWKREEEQNITHRVYFLYSCNRIKIGTSIDAERRFAAGIAPYCPVPITILGTIPGGVIRESRLHARFKEAAIGNEWFDLSPDLRDFLYENKDRATRLRAAEDEYRRWLRLEITSMERENDDPPHRPGGAALRPVPLHSGSERTSAEELARQDGRRAG